MTPTPDIQDAVERVRALGTPTDEWITLRVDRALYLDEGREAVLCDRLPSPVTLVLKLSTPNPSETRPHDNA